MEEFKDQIKAKEINVKAITKKAVAIVVALATIVAVAFMYLDTFGVIEAPKEVIELVPDSLKH